MDSYRRCSRLFETEVRLVVQYPLVFLLLPLLFTVASVFAAICEFRVNESKQSLEMFLPDSMDSLQHLRELMQLFPPVDALHDSYSLFGSKFAYVVYEDVGEMENVFNSTRVAHLSHLHEQITKDVSTESGADFAELCHRADAGFICAQHPIQHALEDGNQALLAMRLMARYPLLRIGNNVTVDNAVVFGGVRLANGTRDRYGNSLIARAKAVRLIYMLNATLLASDEWIEEFIAAMQKTSLPETRLFYTSSNSLPKEMERNGQLLLPWLPFLVLFMSSFCALSCASWDAVRSQPFAGLASLLSAFLAVCSATATLVYLQYPYLHIVLIMPFLVISIGVDNSFLMLKSWRLRYAAATRQQPLTAEEVGETLVESISEVAVSIFLTFLTDALSFAIGTLSDFLAVRVFCTYCAVAILLLTINQFTIFLALMSLYCAREAAGRHWLLCRTIRSVGSAECTPATAHFKTHSPCATGTFHWRYASFLRHPAAKLFILLLYSAYLSFAIAWISRLRLGLDLKLLTPDDSFVAEELRAQERLFADYGAFCFCVIRTARTRLHKSRERRKMLALYEELTSGPLASKGDFWLVAFEERIASNRTALNTESAFYAALSEFLRRDESAKYRNDLRLNATGHVVALKMTMRVRKLGPENDTPRADFLRQRFAASRYEGFVYDTGFLLADQESVSKRNVLCNVVAAIGVMLLVSVLFIPKPMAAAGISLCILSINAGVVGMLSWAGTRLDIISMITIVMSIGFSVDYSTHVTLHFLLHRDRRLEAALRLTASPVTQAALSTLVGVAILAAVPSYMVRTFFYTVVFVVLIGVVHALLFLPALLDSIVPDEEYLTAYTPLARKNHTSPN